MATGNTVSFVLRIADLDPQLDREGNLTIAIPHCGGSMFNQHFVEQLVEDYGQDETNRILDSAGEQIHRMLIGGILSKRVMA